MDADPLGELLLGHALLLAQGDHVFGEVYGPLMVDRHEYRVSQHRNLTAYRLT
jgi:hypothetical protein